MSQWVSWPIKGGSATSIFLRSGTVHQPRSLLNPDELTMLNCHIVWVNQSDCQLSGQLIHVLWVSWRALDPPQCGSAPAKTWLGPVSWNYTLGHGSHCLPEHRWDQHKFSLVTKLPFSPIQYYLHFFPMISSLGITWPGLVPWILPVIFQAIVWCLEAPIACFGSLILKVVIVPTPSFHFRI